MCIRDRPECPLAGLPVRGGAVEGGVAQFVPGLRCVQLIESAFAIQVSRCTFGRVEDGVPSSSPLPHAGEHLGTTVALLDGHHVLLLADDVPTLGSPAQLHRRLGR